MANQEHKAWSLAKLHLCKAQTNMSGQKNCFGRPVDFDVEDYVWLDMRHFPKQRLSKKLGFSTNGEFLITEKFGNSHRLALSLSMMMHNFFSHDKLRLASSDLLPGQVNKKANPYKFYEK